MQNYLFLVSREQENPSYHFVPYHFGCYSFQADADKRTLAKYGLIRQHNKWVLDSQEGFLRVLRPEDRTVINKVVNRLTKVRGRELVRYVYRSSPYFAINSDTRANVLNAEELEKVEALRPEANPPRLFTIATEAVSRARFSPDLTFSIASPTCRT